MAGKAPSKLLRFKGNVVKFEFMGHVSSSKPVERLFPFAIRSRILLIGRENASRALGKLHFVLVTEDISENSKAEALREFMHYPVVQRYTADDTQRFFGAGNAKVIGFKKSELAASIYRELKEFRVNTPVARVKRPKATEAAATPPLTNPPAAATQNS